MWHSPSALFHASHNALPLFNTREKGKKQALGPRCCFYLGHNQEIVFLGAHYEFILITIIALFFNNAFICEHFLVLHDVKRAVSMQSFVSFRSSHLFGLELLRDNC